MRKLAVYEIKRMCIFISISRVSRVLFLLCVSILLVVGMTTTVSADTISEKKQRFVVVQETISSLESELVICGDNKVKAHDLANQARALGLPEEDAVIVRAKEIWSTNNDRALQIQNELVMLRTESQELEKFNNMRYVGDFKLTGYCACYSCCGKSPSSPGYGITAMGTRATEGRTIAMDKRFAFGTRVYIEGLGERVVEDRGGSIKGNRIDVYCNSHSACFSAKYNQTAKIYIIE